METGQPWDERSLESLPPAESRDVRYRASSWSPDGRRLAMHRQLAGGNDGIYVYSLDSRPDGVSAVAPSRDDRRIFGLGSIEADVWLMSLE